MDDRVVQVSLFGAFALMDADGDAVPISSSRARAVLAMLCVAPGEALERDHVSRLLWPGRFQAQARASLRQCLLVLERALADHSTGVLVVTGGTLAIDAARVRCDVDALVATLEARRVSEACDLLAVIGNKLVLDQMDFGEAFADWVRAQRARVEGRLKVAVSRALAALLDDGETAGHDRLREAWVASGRADAGPRDDLIRLAVLPFEQRDELGGPLFLADAVVEELQARLSGVAGLAVVGRASEASVAGSGRTISAMAAMLGVSHIVEGLVERFAESIRVTLRLVDGRADSVIWTERYAGTMESALRSRPHIGGNMIAALCGALGLEVRSRPARAMTASREAYALYLQGRALTYRAIGDGVLDKAVELLEEALAIAPDFAECWTALAEAHVNVAVFTPCLERVVRSARAAECAARAVALDAGQGHAHAMLGIHEWTKGNPSGALDHGFEAYRLAPGNADVAVRLGSFLLYIGHTRAALPYIEQAIELDPVNGRNFAMLCVAHFNLGQFEPALAAGQRMVDLGFPGMWLAVVQAAMGAHEQAVETYNR